MAWKQIKLSEKEPFERLSLGRVIGSEGTSIVGFNSPSKDHIDTNKSDDDSLDEEE